MTQSSPVNFLDSDDGRADENAAVEDEECAVAVEIVKNSDVGGCAVHIVVRITYCWPRRRRSVVSTDIFLSCPWCRLNDGERTGVATANNR